METRGRMLFSSPQPFPGGKEKFFLHKIGEDKREGADEKEQMTKERRHVTKKMMSLI